MRGAPAGIDRLTKVAQRHGLHLLEDTAQALGGSYHGRRSGTIGDHPEMWPRTLELPGRAVHLDVSPELTEEQAEEVAGALHKVLRSL